ncbi:cupin domain-containing protein [Rhodophyticola sp. CCM32]|nr:cupin domain-containing protein [Rhodophyticola sp. CCM32]
MQPGQPSEKFGAKLVDVNGPLGLTAIGAMMTIVQPGKRAFPFHNHLANDEMFVILEGQGTYRFGDAEYAVKAGDICGAPKGGPDRAHQLINTGDGVLRYLGISTRNDPDVVEYPDSGKFAALAVAPGRISCRPICVLSAGSRTAPITGTEKSCNRHTAFDCHGQAPLSCREF